MPAIAQSGERRWIWGLVLGAGGAVALVVTRPGAYRGAQVWIRDPEDQYLLPMWHMAAPSRIGDKRPGSGLSHGEFSSFIAFGKDWRCPDPLPLYPNPTL